MNISRPKTQHVPEWVTKNRADENHANADTDPKYEVLFSIRNWRITINVEAVPLTQPNLSGPSMWHKGCNGFTHILSRSQPQCQKCFRKIPERIQTVYTLLNWQYGNNEEYFRE